MDEWRFNCETAVRRASKQDLGAVAAKEGILGLPLSVNSNKAQRVYDAAKSARSIKLAKMLARKQKPLVEGSTGFSDIDATLAAIDHAAIVE